FAKAEELARALMPFAADQVKSAMTSPPTASSIAVTCRGGKSERQKEKKEKKSRQRSSRWLSSLLAFVITSVTCGLLMLALVLPPTHTRGRGLEDTTKIKRAVATNLVPLVVSTSDPNLATTPIKASPPPTTATMAWEHGNRTVQTRVISGSEHPVHGGLS